MEKPQILAIGEIIWDLYGEQAVLGGAPLNVARHLAALGSPAALLSAVGDDTLGRKTFDQLCQSDIKTVVRRDPHRPTGTASVVSEGIGAHHFRIDHNAAWAELIDNQQHHSPELQTILDSSPLIVFGTLAMSHPTNKSWFSTLPQTVPKLCDLNLRAPHYDAPLVEWALQQCDYLKVNEEEIEYLAQMHQLQPNTTRSVQTELMERYTIRAIMTTLGPKGIELHRRKKTPLHLPAAPIQKMVDTVGAGDAVTAVWAHHIARQTKNPHTIILEAAERAAKVCQHQGPFPL